jgi:hypothetical protein
VFGYVVHVPAVGVAVYESVYVVEAVGTEIVPSVFPGFAPLNESVTVSDAKV